ncbi:MAG: tetratricopeptide (TPR) repeat protein [Kiritimatiellia bacterium]|jgi:tetratricopeptide (TPR) repeat protein
MDEPKTAPRKARKTPHATCHHWLGLLLAVGVFAAYLYTLSPQAYPGDSAHLLTTHSGIDPLRPLSNPIYGSIVRAVARLDATRLVHRMNLFSALCGAACVWMVFILGYRSQWDKERAWRFKGLYLVQGGVSALFFAFTTSVWFASSRAYPVMFDLFLLLSAVYLINTYRWTERRWLLFAFALLSGIGAVEYTTFYLWMLPLGAYTIFYMFKHEHLTTFNMAVMVVLGLLGLSLYLLYAWWYYQLPVAEYREVPTYMRVLRHMGHEQFTSFANSLPKLGWLTVGLVSVFPWLLTVLFSRAKTQTTDKTFALVFFLLLLVAIASAVFFNTVLSPWVLIGHSPLLVAPLVFTALSFGWCAAHWFALTQAVDAHGYKKVGLAPFMSGLLVGSTALVFTAAGAVVNYHAVDTRAARTLNDWADQTLESLGDRTWMISTGIMDDLYLIAAHQKGQTLHLLSVANDSQPSYRAYYASLQENDRLKSLSRIGMGALLSEWFSLDPDLPDKLAVEDRDTIWSSYRIPSVPLKTYFAGAQKPDPEELPGAVAENVAYWTAVQAPLQGVVSMKNPASPYAETLLMQTSRKANNLGVLCEEFALKDEARLLYPLSRKLFDKNLSALLNNLILARGEPDFQTLELEVQAIMADTDSRMSLSTLVNVYGTIFAQDAYLLMRDLWNIEDPHVAQPEAYQAMRELYLAGEKEACLKKLDVMVRNTPEDLYAWNFYAALAAEMNDEAALYTCLNRMRARGQQWPLLLEVMGNLELSKGNLERARNYYEESIKAGPMNTPLVERLVRMDMDEKDVANGRRHIRQLLTLDPGNDAANLMLGMIHFMYRDYNLAEIAFRSSIERKPSSAALNNLAWILHLKDKNQEALPFIKQAIEMNHDSYSSWDTLAVILFELEGYSSAHTAVDKAISLSPDNINPYIHRAQIYAKQGEREKALAVVQEIKLKFAEIMQTKHTRALEIIEGL